ncbi:phosphotransferase [Nocardioides sp. NPDC101246]|uniref:phosphotransferase n=1 Tax=Nocardioides sp. NPDC101246 TaxID=3364336 RepID=UPI0038210885
MNNQIQFPKSVDDVTADWLTQALASRYPGTRVARVVNSNVIWGTATKILLEVEYDQAPAEGGPGTKLCVKGELDERVREAMSSWESTPTQLEVTFYDDLLPRLSVPVSPVYFGLTEPGVGGILIMDDLNEQSVRFGDPRTTWSVDEVASGLDTLAALHGSTWGKDFSDVPQIKVGSPTVRSAVAALFSEESWESTMSAPTAPPLPETFDRSRILRAYEASFKYDDAADLSLVHGDAHLANAFLTQKGEAIFLDWAGPCMAPWSFDVGYFVTSALDPEVRRASARDLLDHYLAALARHGGPVLDREEAWVDFRRHQLHGVIWAMLPTTMHPTESVHAMTERYASAIEDYNTFELLEA